MRTKIFILLILKLSFVYSQKETAIWYFGQNAGLNFNYTPPKPLLNGKIDKWESNGCLSDSNGKLLYYTDGDSIWNSNNKLITNGFGLKGESSASQSSIILKNNKSNKIYIFTNQAGGGDSSLFFINLVYNDSLFIKNKKLLKYGSEKLCAVNHQNNFDIWVSTHSYNNDSFYFYLLKRNEIIDCPIIFSSNRFKFDKYSSVGLMKFSPSGQYLITNYRNNNKTSFISFNNENASIIKQFYFDNLLPYSSEFSNNSKYLYVCDGKSSIYQYNLSVFDSTKIFNSKFEVKKLAYGNIIGMQLALDRKIYVIRPNATSLDVILSPDSSKSKADYRDKYQYLGGQACAYGLPNFNASYFYTPSIDYAYEQDCRTNTIAFEGKDTIKATSHIWIFSKGTKTDTRATKEANYTFADTGKWQVKYIASNGSRSDTVSKTITIRPKLEQGFLGKDLFYCQTLPQLKAPQDLHCIHWYNDTLLEIGKTDSIQITKPGTYFAKATNLSFCVEWDTIQVTKTAPKADFEAKDVCENDSAEFINKSTDVQFYIWDFGDGKTSSEKNSKHIYNIISDYTFNVKLICISDSECKDSVVKPITIIKNPKSEFSCIRNGNSITVKALYWGYTDYKWIFDNIDSLNYNKTTIVYKIKNFKPVDVCLKVTNGYGCYSKTCMSCPTLDVKEIIKQETIKIYPNPAKDIFHIEISKAGDYIAKLYTIEGKLVLTKQLKGTHKQSIEHKLPKGEYIIIVIDQKGNSAQKVLVVE